MMGKGEALNLVVNKLEIAAPRNIEMRDAIIGVDYRVHQ